MWDITSISEVTLIGFASIAVLGTWVALEFYLGHRSFKARERLYLSISERIRRGEPVSPHEYEELLPEDRAALCALQQSKKTMSASHALSSKAANHHREGAVAHTDVTPAPIESHAAAVGNRG